MSTYSKKSCAGVTKSSTSQSLKTSHRKGGKGLSLKTFVRNLADDRATAWFHNKRVATSKGPLGIGRTRKKKLEILLQ